MGYATNADVKRADSKIAAAEAKMLQLVTQERRVRKTAMLQGLSCDVSIAGSYSTYFATDTADNSKTSSSFEI